VARKWWSRPPRERDLAQAKRALAQTPDDARRQREVQRLERVAAKAGYYDAAREFARIVSSNCQNDGKCDYVIVTGRRARDHGGGQSRRP
jgi:hypothetical protein